MNVFLKFIIIFSNVIVSAIHDTHSRKGFDGLVSSLVQMDDFNGWWSVSADLLFPNNDHFPNKVHLQELSERLNVAEAIQIEQTKERRFLGLEWGIDSVSGMLSIDGYVDLPLARDEGIRVQASSYKARFLRLHPPAHFYHTLTQRLDFGGGVARATPAEG